MVVMVNRQKIVSLLFLLWIAQGCAFFRPSGSEPSAPGLLLEGISRKTDIDGTFMAQAAIDIFTPEGKYPLKAAVVLRKPDRLRIESLPIIGPPDFIFVANGVSLRVYSAVQGKFYKGRATAKNLSRFLPVGLSPEDVVSILIGRVPCMLGKYETMKGATDGSLYRIDEISANGIARSLWVDPAGGNLVGARVYSVPGIVSYRVRFQEFIQREGKTLPRKVEITVGRTGAICVTIRYSDIQLVADTDLSLFDLSEPPGIESIMME
jgi:outer membrane lipoprotein-sorting protein